MRRALPECWSSTCWWCSGPIEHHQESHQADQDQYARRLQLPNGGAAQASPPRSMTGGVPLGDIGALSCRSVTVWHGCLAAGTLARSRLPLITAQWHALAIEGSETFRKQAHLMRAGDGSAARRLQNNAE